LNSTGLNVKTSAEPNDQLISAYDPSQGDYVGGVQHINMASVAKVCDTDILSVELIIKEIVAQLRY